MRGGCGIGAEEVSARIVRGGCGIGGTRSLRAGTAVGWVGIVRGGCGLGVRAVPHATAMGGVGIGGVWIGIETADRDTLAMCRIWGASALATAGTGGAATGAGGAATGIGFWTRGLSSTNAVSRPSQCLGSLQVWGGSGAHDRPNTKHTKHM